jgi:hypothetical protein
MAEVLELPPFPLLMWEGLYWQADFTLPWYRVAPPRNPKKEKTHLVLRPNYSRSIQKTDFAAAPRPTDAQASSCIGTESFYFGMAEEAGDEAPALKDLRRIARARKPT